METGSDGRRLAELREQLAGAMSEEERRSAAYDRAAHEVWERAQGRSSAPLQQLGELLYQWRLAQLAAIRVSEAIRDILHPAPPDGPPHCWECGCEVAERDLVHDAMGPAHRSCVGA